MKSTEKVDHLSIPKTDHSENRKKKGNPHFLKRRPEGKPQTPQVERKRREIEILIRACGVEALVKVSESDIQAFGGQETFIGAVIKRAEATRDRLKGTIYQSNIESAFIRVQANAVLREERPVNATFEEYEQWCKEHSFNIEGMNLDSFTKQGIASRFAHIKSEKMISGERVINANASQQSRRYTIEGFNVLAMLKLEGMDEPRDPLKYQTLKNRPAKKVQSS